MPLPPVPPPVLPKAACFAVGVHNHWTQFYEHYHWLPEYLHTREEELEVQHAQEGSQGQGSAPSAPPPATIYETVSALFSPAGRTVSESAVRGVMARAPASSASSSVVLDLLGSRPVFSEHVLSNELFDFTYRNHIFRMHNREGNVVVFFPHASLMGTSSSAPSSATGTQHEQSDEQEQEAADVGTSSSTPRRRVFFEKEDVTSDQKTLLHDPHTEETVGVASCSSTTSSAGPDQQVPKTPEQMQKMKGAEQFVDHCHLHEFDYYEQRTIYYDGDFLSDISTACSPRDHPQNCFSSASASEDDPMALFSAASSASDASDGEDYYFYDKEIVRSDRSCPASPPSHLLDPEFEFELNLKEEEAHGGIFGSSSSSTRTVVRRGAPDYEEDRQIKVGNGNGAGSSCTTSTTNRAARGSCKSPRSPRGGVAGRAMSSSTSLDPTRQHWTLRNGRLEREEAWTITSGRGIGGNSSNVATSGHQYSHLQPGVQGCRPLIICGMSRI